MSLLRNLEDLQAVEVSHRKALCSRRTSLSLQAVHTRFSPFFLRTKRVFLIQAPAASSAFLVYDYLLNFAR